MWAGHRRAALGERAGPASSDSDGGDTDMGFSTRTAAPAAALGAPPADAPPTLVEAVRATAAQLVFVRACDAVQAYSRLEAAVAAERVRAHVHGGATAPAPHAADAAHARKPALGGAGAAAGAPQAVSAAVVLDAVNVLSTLLLAPGGGAIAAAAAQPHHARTLVEVCVSCVTAAEPLVRALAQRALRAAIVPA
jgi:hypothetical protein